MASISFNKANGTFTIQVVGPDRKRRSVRLGKVTKRQAEAVKLRVESLNAAAQAKVPWDGELAAWVSGVGDELADRLAAAGLIPARTRSTLAAFVDTYI